jgi:hypothetical protein
VRFQRVHVQAFGPFHDRSIDLAPGLTVVFGLNEAGKSTWHAALYAAFCWLRRGLGATTREEREFAAHHRPRPPGARRPPPGACLPVRQLPRAPGLPLKRTPLALGPSDRASPRAWPIGMDLRPTHRKPWSLVRGPLDKEKSPSMASAKAMG